MFQSFQRLKGSIERSLAEEQARQRESNSNSSSSSSSKPGGAASSTPARRSASTSRGAKSGSPARRPRPKKPSQDTSKDAESLDGNATANPDPAVFEAAFVLDDSEEASRAGTPRPAEKDGKAESSGKQPEEASSQDDTKTDGEEPSRSLHVEQPSKSESELPMEVRVKLRKFERLEATYTELLRSYRIAHGRAKSVEAFERVLKENTPLTSIADPNALVEYVNQLNLKSDMVMDELKRVSSEKDGLRQRCDEQETEVKSLKEQLDTAKTEAGTRKPATGAKEESRASPPPPGDEAAAKETTEEFFSFDNEVQADVAAKAEEVEKLKAEEVEKLKAEVQSLTGQLSVAKETSAGLAENLERTARELSEARDASAVQQSLETQLEARNAEIETLTERLGKSQTRLREVEQELGSDADAFASTKKELEGKLATAQSRSDELDSEVRRLFANKSELQSKIDSLTTKTNSLEAAKKEDEEKLAQLDTQLKESRQLLPPTEEATPGPALASTPATSTSSKKKNKKKKKGGATATATDASAAQQGIADQPTTAPAGTENKTSHGPSNTDALEAEMSRLKEQMSAKDMQIERLSKQRKTEEDLREEIETMQENLLAIGQDHVEAKEKIKDLEREKATLQARIAGLEGELKDAVESSQHGSEAQKEASQLKQECEDLLMKTSRLQTDLGATQQLAQSRYKDLTDLREVLQKAQPELKSLRQDSAALKTTKDELSKKAEELRNAEKKEREMKMELTRAQRLASDRDVEIKALRDKVAAETNNRLRLEDEKRVAGRDLRRSEAEKVEVSARQEKASRELKQAQEEVKKLRPRVRELEDQVERLQEEKKALQGETELKTQQYANAQGLLGSMRDQTAELTMQLKEARSQAESLDEELTEVQRLLGERTREGETMRRLLADVDERADAKVREMRTRMEAAVEERDRMEDESATLARRKTRETEELKQKMRQLEREVRNLTAEKDELEQREREWRKRRDDLESVEARAEAEVGEMRSAVSDLRATLDASEQQVRQAEKQKTDLRKLLDESHQKYEKVARDLKAAQAKLSASASRSPARGSMDSTTSGGPVNGSGGSGGGAGGAGAGADLMYLRTVLQQFVDQKENKLRLQLVPVLGKLLKLDKADEKKWMDFVLQMGGR